MTPADPERCQAEVWNGNTFMTHGGIPGRVRCNNKPVVIAYELEAAEDGYAGCMALCAQCRDVFVDTMGEEAVAFTDINKTVRKVWGMACPECGRDDELQVEVRALCYLDADGTDDYGDHEWDPDSWCSCALCDWHGKVKDATIETKEQMTALNEA